MPDPEKTPRHAFPRMMQGDTTSTADLQSPSAAKYRPLRLDAPDHERGTLATFYLSLDREQRRARFRGGVSDAAIFERCLTLNAADAIVIGCFDSAVLVAAAELHRIGQGWRRAEIALCCPSRIGESEAVQTDTMAHLVQIAIFQAVMNGCLTLMCLEHDQAAPWLRQLGRYSEQDGLVSVGISATPASAMPQAL